MGLSHRENLSGRGAIIHPQMSDQTASLGNSDSAGQEAHNPRVTLGLIQMRCTRDPSENFEKAVENIRQAAARGARIICLQELFLSHYFCQTEDVSFFNLAEPIPGPSTNSLSGLATELKVIIVAPIFERRTAGIYHNSAVVIDEQGELVGKYRKMHIPDDPFYYEKFYFTPGDLGFHSYRTRYGEVGVLICWDQWFPEAARLTALKGAQILFYPTAIAWLEGEPEEASQTQQAAWETIQRGHAVANGVFLAAVNRVGQEGPLKFWGQSFVCDPLGKILAKASPEQEEILIVECDLGKIEETRRNWPFLRDRRIEAYRGLSSRFNDPATEHE
jgi:N-carbamoylputrescine amidase